MNTANGTVTGSPISDNTATAKGSGVAIGGLAGCKPDSDRLDDQRERWQQCWGPGSRRDSGLSAATSRSCRGAERDPGRDPGPAADKSLRTTHVPPLIHNSAPRRPGETRRSRVGRATRWLDPTSVGATGTHGLCPRHALTDSRAGAGAGRALSTGTRLGPVLRCRGGVAVRSAEDSRGRSRDPATTVRRPRRTFVLGATFAFLSCSSEDRREIAGCTIEPKTSCLDTIFDANTDLHDADLRRAKLPRAQFVDDRPQPRRLHRRRLRGATSGVGPSGRHLRQRRPVWGSVRQRRRGRSGTGPAGCRLRQRRPVWGSVRLRRRPPGCRFHRRRPDRRQPRRHRTARGNVRAHQAQRSLSEWCRSHRRRVSGHRGRHD